MHQATSCVLVSHEELPPYHVTNRLRGISDHALSNVMLAVKREVGKIQHSKALLEYGNVNLGRILSKELNLNEQDQKELKTVLGFIVHKHDVIATWIPAVTQISNNGVHTFKYTKSTRQKLVDSNIMAGIPGTTLREGIINIMLTWEEQSQKAWAHRIVKQHSLSKEKKHFHTNERIMCLLAHKYSQNGFKSIPLDVIKEICKYLPVTLYGGLVFSTIEQWKWESSGVCLILSPCDSKFTLYNRSVSLPAIFCYQGKYEMQGDGNLVLRCETQEVITTKVINRACQDVLWLKMLVDAKNGGVAVKHTEYVLREIPQSVADKLLQIVEMEKNSLKNICT